MELMFRKIGKTLIPANKYAEQDFATFKEGASILIGLKKKRNPQHHRKLLGMLHYLVENTDHFRNKDAALDALKWNAGIYKTSFQWNRHRQEMMPVQTLESISFSSMDQHKFEEFYKESLDFIAELTRDDPKKVKLNLESYY